MAQYASGVLDRGLVAFMYLTRMRVSAAMGLRWSDVDVANCRAFQSGQIGRAKNGKAYKIFWFPVPDEIKACFLEWHACAKGLGLGPRDAVFPASKQLKKRQNGDDPLEPMASSAAALAAFRAATGGAYTPHSARHALAALGYEKCNNAQHLKAWSMNLGHETPQITQTHYGKPSEEDREVAFQELSTPPTANFGGEGPPAGLDEILEKIRDLKDDFRAMKESGEKSRQ